MPSKPLSRSLIAEIQQNRSTDCLEIDSLDSEELDLPMLGQLFNEALQQTTRLTVLELTGLNQAAATVVATALRNPQCQLKALVLKRMDKSAVTEIADSLRAVPARRLSITEAGLTDSTCHAVYINLSQATMRYHFQCTDRSRDWLQRVGDVNLLAPLALKPLMDFSSLMPAERLHRSSPASPSAVARTTNASPWLEDTNVTPNTRERALAHLSLSEEDDCIDLTRQVRGYSPLTPGVTHFITSPALNTGLSMGRPPFSSPGSPQTEAFHALRGWLHPSSGLATNRSPTRRYASLDNPLSQMHSPNATCPPPSPCMKAVTSVANAGFKASSPITHVDSPARTLLAFMPTVLQRPAAPAELTVKCTRPLLPNGTP